jgi:hypothetical protein
MSESENQKRQLFGNIAAAMQGVPEEIMRVCLATSPRPTQPTRQV